VLIPLAHFGHVLIDLPLFGGPVIFLVAALMWSAHREKKRQRDHPGGQANA
jgi:hypothetical protein